MEERSLCIDGVAFWSPGLPHWTLAQAAFRDGTLPPAGTAPARPAPALMAANERRRASASVLLALEVAGSALAASGQRAGAIASVFTSAHGDLEITDAVCRALALDPLQLSPTRFHHAVHNAASGYWAIASGCRAASTAVSAFDASFTAGLLEAACLCATEEAPVLLVGCDTAACGPLASVNRSRGLLAVALVLAPTPGPASRWSLRWSLREGQGAAPPLQSAAAQALAGNALADALPLCEALAGSGPTRLALPLSASLQLTLQLSGLDPAP
jgi:hypothetical protein